MAYARLNLEIAIEDAARGISEAVRILDLMGRGGAARDLAIYGNNLTATLRALRESEQEAA